MEAGRVLLLLILLLVSAQSSECVRCFAHFNLHSGVCDREIGDVDEDDCCQNPMYGYQGTDGKCRSCGLAIWSPWSSWSPCNMLCGEGVRQRSRKCFGIGQSKCVNPGDNLRTESCNGTCCHEKGWGLWLSWSQCSVTCGGVGLRQRKRICSSSSKCSLTCNGPSEETETCEAHNTCPVHGGWSGWSGWSNCSASCNDDKSGDVNASLRVRQRLCDSPAPSNNTVPPGNHCPGDARQIQRCSELPNCPVDGGWGKWSSPGQCSVTCGEGIRLSIRTCDNPAPKYGGRFCEGTSTRTHICQSPCPVDGFWTGWSTWSECSSVCIPEGLVPVRIRHRSCSNPAPSSSPPGRGCHGDGSQKEHCIHLLHCPVDGSWGSWSSFSDCSVTCGVGLKESVRTCDSPAPKHGGHPCHGAGRRTIVCSTNVHCPVDGMWSEWSPWSPCKHPWKTLIRCSTKWGGSQSRDRKCLHQAHNGSYCSGDLMSQSRVCYDVHNCKLPGSLKDWGSWSLCQPACGENSERVRKRICEPDYSSYRTTIGMQGEEATFFGTPVADCDSALKGGQKNQSQYCLNVPPCT